MRFSLTLPLSLSYWQFTKGPRLNKLKYTSVLSRSWAQRHTKQLGIALADSHLSISDGSQSHCGDIMGLCRTWFLQSSPQSISRSYFYPSGGSDPLLHIKGKLNGSSTVSSARKVMTVL
jgi:hypothetical protein